MKSRNGGDLLVDVLRANDVPVVFGLVSVHNLPLVEAVDRSLRFVPVRHEAAAVNAADGCARASGGLGCALTSTGTGAGNAAGAMIEALSAGGRVLHVTGQIDSEFLGRGRGVIHETKDQLGMLTAISKAALTVGEDASGVLREAVRLARTKPYGPVSVEWPIDLQYHPPPRDHGIVRLTAGSAQKKQQGEGGGRLVAEARRPVIWAGGGAKEAGEPLRKLAERLGAPIFTSNAGRGAVPEDHELVVGNFAASPAAMSLLENADLLISVGTHFRSNETKHYKLRLPERHLQIDIDEAAIGRVYPATAAIVGDAAKTLSALLSAVQAGTSEPGWRAQAVQTRQSVRDRLRSEIGPYSMICDALRSNLDRASPIARDVTIPSSQWGNRLLPIYDPRTNIFPLGGGIGQGLAMGIGAGMARPDVPTLVIAGDGGLTVHLGELATLAQERPWLVLVVFNDGGYGVLRNMQDVHLGRRSGVDLHTPSFGILARSMGIRHDLVTAADSFGDAFAKAVAAREPWMLEVDVTAIGPPPVPFVPPVSVP